MPTSINAEGAVWTVRPRRLGTVHIIRTWAVCRDGEEIDRYEDRSLAQSYADYQNSRGQTLDRQNPS